MGETPEVVKIACPGCETQFRLKPKKGRLPQGPVPCPKCGESIPIVEENIRRDGSRKGQSAPQAHVFNKAGTDPKNTRGATATGSPADPPQSREAASADDSDDDGDDFDHIAVAPGLSKSNPKSTFLGMGSALQSIAGSGPASEPTAVVDGDLLAKIRSESSVVEDDDNEKAEPAKKSDGPLRQTSENDVFRRETSENKAIGPEAFARNKQAQQDREKHDRETGEQDTPGQMVLGKIKIKKKLKRSLKKKQSKQKVGSRAPAKPTVSDKATTAKTTTKPSLSSLLKKARQKKDKLGLPQSKSGKARDASSDDPSSKNLDRALDELAQETAQSIADKHSVSEPDAKAPAFDSGDSSMIDMLRRRVAENQQPGAASERRGSGYIRLPTAEIQDVLGQGTYRLRVEDIVYEPIDKEGLTQLVKRGVLLGAEQIAEPDGDWMPIADHPVFLELRRKMAREAHDLLKQYKPKSDTDEAAADVDLPGRRDELPGRVAELPAMSPDKIDDAPEIEADLEEEAEQAAKSLFDDVDDDDEAVSLPPPMPSSNSPKSDPPAETTDTDVDADTDGSSVEFDYNALGVEKDDVKVSKAYAAEETETVSRSLPKSSMRTWVPLIAAAAVLLVLAGFALTPFGRAYLADVPYLDGILGESSSEGAVHGNPATSTKSVVSNTMDDEQRSQAGAKTAEAISEASQAVAGALDVDPSDAALQESVADELAKAGDYAGASRVMGVLWQQRGDDADFAANYADVLIQAGHFGQARQVALDGLQLETDAHDFAKVFAQAVEKNPALGAYDVVDVSQKMGDAATVSADGKQIILELSRDGAPAFHFKPSQSGWENGWRTSVASYRLCQIMVCNFSIPRTRPARIDKTTFEALVNAEDAGFATKLAWVSEGGKKYVYGALQDTTKDTARFPIELTETWRGWLSTGGDADMASVPATKALAGLRNQPGGFYEPLVSQLGDTSLESLAAQLSSVLVFDFLTNNWSRFQSGEEKWGTHLHVADSQLVSMHNGNAFQPRASTRIKGRFSWTSRFSKDTIASLRLMNPKLVTDRLFPNATAGEKARLDVFWSQRDAALERIDKLAGAHGDKEVLAFE